MARPKGGPKYGGRKKGTPNKDNAAIKAMIEQALSQAGGVDYLTRQADENPTAFMGLVGKVLPMQVNHGDNTGGPLTGITVTLIGAHSERSAS